MSRKLTDKELLSRLRELDMFYCEDCKHPRGMIQQSETPLQPKFENNGSLMRCGVCGSPNIRPLFRDYLTKGPGKL